MVGLLESFKTVDKNRVIVKLLRRNIPLEPHYVAAVVNVTRNRSGVVSVREVGLLLFISRAQQAYSFDVCKTRTRHLRVFRSGLCICGLIFLLSGRCMASSLTRWLS